MAFPTIPTVADSRVNVSLEADATGTRTFPSLSSLTKAAGDLLIAIIAVYQFGAQPSFSSWGGGFTEFEDAGVAGSSAGFGAAYKWSDGTETGTFDVTQAATVTGHAAMFVIVIPGAHATTPPESEALATGTSTAADPNALAPSWGAEDTLWIAVAVSGETATAGSFTGVASAPANYGNYVETGISADVVGGVEAALAFRQLNTASEDVGTFSVDLSNARNSAMVIAVRPAGAPGPIHKRRPAHRFLTLR